MIGDIKEKILAAKRLGINTIILCENNRKDVNQVKEDYIKGLKFHYVTRMEDVIELALEKNPIKQAVPVNRPEFMLTADGHSRAQQPVNPPS